MHFYREKENKISWFTENVNQLDSILTYVIHVITPESGDKCKLEGHHKEEEFWRRTPIMKGTPEEELDAIKKKNITENVKVSSLVMNVKEKTKRRTRGVGDDFIADGLGSKRMSKTQRVDPNKKFEQYKDFDTLKLISSMEDDDDDKRKLKIFFERTIPSECAWRSINESGEEILVLGLHVQDLVDHSFLEAELLQYYIIPDGVQELFIRIFSSKVSHWTLLHFNFGDHNWRHYNSFKTKSAIDEFDKMRN
ncbi:hypothetical protein MKW98_021136 [Papaver atlanticum]|uniref:Uncharacterized protein n=1 Tax=Papaver atlanticum TaxID=357466 RepID=A0AAD4TB79_9MAGN|nr:hypothetical protein MKW98_021136 [Papaver atlanticum]